MFVFGLVVGSAIALALYHFLVVSNRLDRRLVVAIFGLVFILVIAVGPRLELKLGLLFGLALGLLLAATPMGHPATPSKDEDPERYPPPTA
jgi:hypothetical protein